MLLNLPRARAVMARHGLDAVLLAHPNNFVYATDYLVPSTFSFLDRPFLVLLFRDPATAPVAIVPGWDLPDFRRRSWMERSIGYTEYATDRDGDLMPSWQSALAACLEALRGVSRLGVEERYLPKWIVDELARMSRLSLIDATSTNRTIRSVKTPE